MRNPWAGSASCLLAPILLLFCPAPSTGEEEDPLGVPSQERRLTLNLDVGKDFTFHATDEVEKRKIDYRMVVQEVGAKGEVTLAVVGFVQPADAESPPAAANAQGTILTLSGEGQVTRTADHLPPVPRAFETHLRLVFGSGLHVLPLAELTVYRLEPLLGPKAVSDAVHLRFEGLVVEEELELARFTVVEGYALAKPAPPQAPGNLRNVTGAEGGAPSGGAPSGGPPTRLTTSPESATTQVSLPVSLEDWVVVGEATYRTADGVLEAARLKGRHPDRQANGSELARLSIRRISAGNPAKAPLDR